MRANSSTVRASPRACGETPAATRAAAAAAADPAQPAWAAVPVRAGPDDVAADGAGPLDLGVPVGLHGRDAVHLRAGCGGEAVGDLRLDHDQGAFDAREGLEHVQQDGDGDVVGE